MNQKNIKKKKIESTGMTSDYFLYVNSILSNAPKNVISPKNKLLKKNPIRSKIIARNDSKNVYSGQRQVVHQIFYFIGSE